MYVHNWLVLEKFEIAGAAYSEPKFSAKVTLQYGLKQGTKSNWNFRKEDLKMSTSRNGFHQQPDHESTRINSVVTAVGHQNHVTVKDAVIMKHVWKDRLL
jgi:hypothetical protein